MQTLQLRQWQDADLAPYTAMNADPEVMRHFPAPLTPDESAASMHRLRSAIDERGWGMWAVEVDGEFAGFTGLGVPRFDAHFTPCVEIGWRFRKKFWGRGIAYRAAIQALDFGFRSLRLEEIVSFTAAGNARSRRLMEWLEFTHDPTDDFDHPAIPDGHRLKRHVLYRKNAEAAAPTNRPEQHKS